jgi:signal transduction histidine kinase
MKRERKTQTNQKMKNARSKFSLRLRLILLVSAEMMGAILLAFGIDAFINNVVFKNSTVPFIVELIIIGLLVGILVTYFLSRLFFDPIKKLGVAMEKVAHGDFEVRVKTKSTAKEINEIYSGFNIMVEELNATEILQTDFVSNVSHEFKTPINAIEGYAMLLQSYEELDEQQREYIDKIVHNTKRLSSLTGSILLLSKIESQSIPTNQTVFSLDEQIRESIVALEPLWSSKSVEFDVEMDRVEYYGNEMLMRHVWDNLIGNAIKFGPEGATVKIRLTKHIGKIVFSVEDDGGGIPEEAQKHIFNKFYQADNSHKQSGNGLGLPLVKKILAIENGDVSVENTEKGCIFTVSLKVKLIPKG